MPGVGIVEVDTLKEAADWMLISDVTRFAREFGEQGRVVIISSDKGFAQVLRYASGCGCRTVVMNDFEKTWRKTQGSKGIRSVQHLSVYSVGMVQHATSASVVRFTREFRKHVFPE